MYTFDDGILVVHSVGDIAAFCRHKDILLKDFNVPVKIAEGMTSCGSLFSWCESFNQYIEIPETVINCNHMFEHCKSFNQPVILPSGLLSAEAMFYRCVEFNQAIALPKTLRNCRYMFSQCWSFNQPVVLHAGLLFDRMFQGCHNLSQSIILPEPKRIQLDSTQAYMYRNVFRECPGKLDLNTFIYSTDEETQRG